MGRTPKRICTFTFMRLSLQFQNTAVCSGLFNSPDDLQLQRLAEAPLLLCSAVSLCTLNTLKKVYNVKLQHNDLCFKSINFEGQGASAEC